MGTANLERHCLQRLNGSKVLATICFSAWALLSFLSSAQAQIFPVSATLAYSSSTPTSAALKIDAIDGSAYELMLQADRDGNGAAVAVDLVLLRSGQERNLLEPKVENWHGAQPFMFVARDLMNGPQGSVYGATRDFLVSKEKLRVRVIISKAIVRKAESVAPLNDIFDELVLSIEVSNSK